MEETPGNASALSSLGAATEAVLRPSEPVPNATAVAGYDFSKGVDYSALLRQMRTVGFQATHFAQAVDIINNMISWRRTPDPDRHKADDNVERHNDDHGEGGRVSDRCTIFLGFTSNMISCGNRDVIRYLVQNRMVDALVTTGGGIEEDLIKCLAPHLIGSFHLDGRDLRRRGLNRIGNLIVPNDNYCKFEDWVMPILRQLVKEQSDGNGTGSVLTPSRLIRRLGKEIDHPDSVLYWAYKNDIPVFCPAITDGSLGDMLYFNSFKAETRLIIDIVEDVVKINNLALHATKTGAIILGGGLVKHHILNANLMRNGADFGVFINTANSWDGSDAGADPDEALSWGKLAQHSNSVKITADASLVFPLIVAETFAQHNRDLN